MNMNELVGKRVICQSRIPGYDIWHEVKECRVVEVSPSGEWVKLAHGKKAGGWERVSEMCVLEVLRGDSMVSGGAV